MRSASETGVFASVFVWMVFALGEATAQFKILGLLDPNMGSDLIDSASPLVKISSFEDNHSSDDGAGAAAALISSGQARGFSVEKLDTSTEHVVQNATTERGDIANIIKVRIMEDHSSHRKLLDVHEPAILENAFSINNGLEVDDVLQLNPSMPLVKPRAFQPHIRKFSYIEERSFHQNGLNRNRFNDNAFEGASQHRNNYVNYNSNQVTKYRNHYKSRCRCERIWNCPKIQITIHRCEQDYFMCCF